MKKSPDHNNNELVKVSNELFQQLTARDIPSVPTQLDAQVHQRLNTALLATHLFDFTCRDLPYATVMILGSTIHFLTFTATGRIKGTPSGQSRKQH